MKDAFDTAPTARAAGTPTPAKVIPYKHEDPLFWMSVYMAVVIWLVLLILTFGLVIPVVLLLGLLGLFTRSLLISWVRGNALKVSPEQFPDLHQQFQYSCQRLGIKRPPELYLCQVDGMLNALAVRFLRQDYVVLLSNIVDALKDRPEAIKFYMGHELGHVQRKHLLRHWWLAPAGVMPLLAPAYARACEYTCDRHGLACCDNLEDAQRALVVLAAGSERWKQVNLGAFEAQSQETGRFWMAVNELTSDYPWLCKRLVRLSNRNASFPRRSAWAWLIAALSPRLGYGGAVIGFIYLLVMGGLILALVLALVFSGSGISDKLEDIGNEVFSELGMGAARNSDSAPVEHSSSYDEHEPAAPPVSAAEMHAIGQTLTRQLDAHIAGAKGLFPKTLHELEDIEELLTAQAQDRWEGIEFGYVAPAESPSKMAEITLEATCAECDEEALVLLYRRKAAGRWSCTANETLNNVVVEGCPAVR
jgi:Zn-dependent protease with chaperone function